jgi:hypothetical protein
MFVPCPGRLWMRMVPPGWSMIFFVIAMPTPAQLFSRNTRCGSICGANEREGRTSGEQTRDDEGTCLYCRGVSANIRLMGPARVKDGLKEILRIWMECKPCEGNGEKTWP